MRAKSPAKELPRTDHCVVSADGPRHYKVEHICPLMSCTTPIGPRLVRSKLAHPDFDVWGKTLEEATLLMHQWTKFLDLQERDKQKAKRKSR